MRIISSVIFLFALCYTLKAQESTILITTYYYEHEHKTGTFEKYYALEKDSTKHGTYEMYSTYGKLLMKGEYSLGKRIGVWEYYENTGYGLLASKFDWDSLKELYFHPYQFSEPEKNLPHFPGGAIVKEEYIQKMIAENNIDYDPSRCPEGEQSIVTFDIAENGKVQNVKLISGSCLDEVNQNALIKIFESMPLWITSGYNEQSYPIPFGQKIIFPIK